MAVSTSAGGSRPSSVPAKDGAATSEKKPQKRMGGGLDRCVVRRTKTQKTKEMATVMDPITTNSSTNSQIGKAKFTISSE